MAARFKGETAPPGARPAVMADAPAAGDRWTGKVNSRGDPTVLLCLAHIGVAGRCPSCLVGDMVGVIGVGHGSGQNIGKAVLAG
jgi:hypothetical protein